FEPTITDPHRTPIRGDPGGCEDQHRLSPLAIIPYPHHQMVMVGTITLIIIVNYRTASLTIDALHSLASEISRHPGSRCIVIDNDSADGSAGIIAEAIGRSGYGDWCDVEALHITAGFAPGNNAT